MQSRLNFLLEYDLNVKASLTGINVVCSVKQTLKNKQA